MHRDGRSADQRPSLPATPGPAHFAYAFRGEQLVHVSAVARGRACDCICAGCGQALIARKGAVRAHHFAHFGTSPCNGGVETVLHRLGKELVATLDWIALPEYRFKAPVRSPEGAERMFERVVFPSRRVRVTASSTETPIAELVADVVLMSGSRKLLVEICVTHAVDRAKLRKVRRFGMSMIEIRLSPDDAMLTRDALRTLLQGDRARKSWLFSPQQRPAEAEWLGYRRAASRERRRPLGSPAPTMRMGKPWIRTEADFIEWARSVRRRR